MKEETIFTVTKKIFVICFLCVFTLAINAQVNDDNRPMRPMGPPPEGGRRMPPGRPGERPKGPGGPLMEKRTGKASPNGYSQAEGNASISSKIFTSKTADENAVQVKGGTLTITDCTIKKLSGDTTDPDGSSFFGTNSALWASGASTKVFMKGGSITSNAAGVNAVMACDSSTINVEGVKVSNKGNLSRGLHATGGATINATDMDITTEGNNSSVIATDRGGGTVDVKGGTYKATGRDCAVIYSTGNITVTGITGESEQGEIGVIEGDNSININKSDINSDSKERGMMILQSGSGDANGFNGRITVNEGCLTLTDSKAPLCEIPTNTTGTLTLKDVELTVPSGTLMKVDFNTRWETRGGKGNLILTTDSTFTYTGNVEADKFGTANVEVDKGVTWKGSIDSTGIAKETSVTVEGTWVLTAESNVDVLTIKKGGAIIENGFKLSAKKKVEK
jgi:hypothetical protein